MSLNLTESCPTFQIKIQDLVQWKRAKEVIFDLHYQDQETPSALNSKLSTISYLHWSLTWNLNIRYVYMKIDDVGDYENALIQYHRVKLGDIL